MYGRMLDQVNYNSNMAVQGQEQNLAQKNEANLRWTAILAAGGRPPAEIVAASGIRRNILIHWRLTTRHRQPEGRRGQQEQNRKADANSGTGGISG